MRHFFSNHFLIHHLLASQSWFQNMFRLEFISTWGKLGWLVLFSHGALWPQGPPRSATCPWAGRIKFFPANLGETNEKWSPLSQVDGIGLSVSESSTSLVVLIHLAPTRKVERVPRYQQASFLVGSLLTFPTASSAFLCLPNPPSAHSFPSAAGSGLNGIELSPRFSLLLCIFHLS